MKPEKAKAVPQTGICPERIGRWEKLYPPFVPVLSQVTPADSDAPFAADTSSKWDEFGDSDSKPEHQSSSKTPPREPIRLTARWLGTTSCSKDGLGGVGREFGMTNKAKLSSSSLEALFLKSNVVR
ncbi:hypothetical protein LINPERHAP2_LOCUS19071 [Linum perenne]